MIRPFFLCLSIIFLFIACQKTESTSADKEAIIKKVNQLYHQYGSSNEAVYYRPISDHLFSPALKKALETAINASKADIEKVKNSDHPDEKPLIFEGAIFSSLYEGYTTYSIQSIDVKGDTADAIIDFENSDFAGEPEKGASTASSKIVWKDRIRFVKDNTGWKIDNIIFDKKAASSTDLKTSLTAFIQYIR